MGNVQPTRRELLLALAALSACGPTQEPARAPTPPPDVPLHVSPAIDLVAAAALEWVVEARPRELFGNLDLIPALTSIVPEKALSAFAAHNGGLDPRQVREASIAAYPEALLVVVASPIEPARVEKAFADRADPLDGRGVDKASAPDGRPFAPATRLWGTVHGERQQLAIFGREGLALERGKFGPLKAAEAFAQQRLKKAKPVLKVAPFSRLAELVGAAPLRMFAPGPFRAEWEAGFAGLLRATAAVGAAARPIAGKAQIAARVVLLGAWSDQASAAAERLKAWFARFGEDPLGRLMGIDRPVDGPFVKATDEALALDVVLDATHLARGVRAATAASVDEIMAY